MQKVIFSSSLSYRAFFNIAFVKLPSSDKRRLQVGLVSSADISQSLNGKIGDGLEISIPPRTSSNNSFTLIDFSLASSFVSSAVGEPPPVLRAEEILSQTIGLCFANTLDHFLETSSLFLKVPWASEKINGYNLKLEPLMVLLNIFFDNFHRVYVNMKILMVMIEYTMSSKINYLCFNVVVLYPSI